MKDKAAVIGEITVELIKKHGSRLTRRENLVTGFGKSAIVANGLATVLSDYSNNKVTFYNAYNSDLFFNRRYTPYAKMVNLLLDSPNLHAGQGMYIPESELVAFAYKSSATAANEGTVSTIADGTSMKKKLTRRFSYGSSISGQFDTIATSMIIPDGTAGAIINIQRKLRAEEIIDNVCCRYLKQNKVQVRTATNYDILDYNLETGEVSTSAAAWPSFGQASYLLSTFEIGDYVYEVRETSPMRNYGTDIQIFGYDQNGVLQYTSPLYQAINTYSCKHCLWYDTTAQKYYLYADGPTYEFVLNSSGLITDIVSTSDSPTVPSTFRVLCGTADASIYVDRQKTYASPEGTTYYTTENNNGIAFQYNNRSFNKSLTEFGNLISYHTFSVPFIKDVGDILNVSYSYFID